MSRKPNFDVNVDGRTNGRTEIWTPISHPAVSRCDNKAMNVNKNIKLCSLAVGGVGGEGSLAFKK